MTLIVPALLAAVGSLGCTPPSGGDCGRREGVVPLFNGKDLAGWSSVKGMTTWFVQDGTIVCDPSRGTNDDYLYTEKRYGDFELSLEFKLNETRANSGVLFRVGDPRRAPATGFEVQVLGDPGEEPSVQSCGALYGVMAPPENYSRGIGEWNHYRIMVKGRQITAYMNDNELYSVNMDDPVLNEKVARSPLRFATPARRRHNTGYIALQNHGYWVAFRNVEIRVLN